MADLAAIRTALAANLSTIPDLQVSAYVLSNPTPPSAVVFAGPTEFDKAFGRGMDMLVFMVRVVVAAVSDISAVVNLDPYMAGSGARSIKAAIESDSTLGGSVFDVSVVGTDGEQIYTFEGRPPALGAEFRVEVTAHG
jgi:hypothetical protein